MLHRSTLAVNNGLQQHISTNVLRKRAVGARWLMQEPGADVPRPSDVHASMMLEADQRYKGEIFCNRSAFPVLEQIFLKLQVCLESECD